MGGQLWISTAPGPYPRECHPFAGPPSPAMATATNMHTHITSCQRPPSMTTFLNSKLYPDSTCKACWPYHSQHLTTPHGTSRHTSQHLTAPHSTYGTYGTLHLPICKMQTVKQTPARHHCLQRMPTGLEVSHTPSSPATQRGCNTCRWCLFTPLSTLMNVWCSDTLIHWQSWTYSLQNALHSIGSTQRDRSTVVSTPGRRASIMQTLQLAHLLMQGSDSKLIFR